MFQKNRFPFLWLGERRLVTSEDFFEEDTDEIQPVLMVVDGCLRVGVLMFKDGKQEHIVAYSLSEPCSVHDIVRAYRAFLFACALPSCDEKKIQMCTVTASSPPAKAKERKAWNACCDMLRELIPDPLFSQIQQAVMSQEEFDEVARMCSARSYPLFTISIEELVDLGVITISESLDDIGVDSKAVRDAANEHEKRIMDGVMPHLRAYAATRPQFPKCRDPENLLHEAAKWGVHAFIKNIDEPHLPVGMAVLALAASIDTAQVGLEGMAAAAFEHDNKVQLAPIAAFLKKQFPEIEEDLCIYALTDLMERWTDIPCTRPLGEPEEE